jgi:hypothetical protein
MKNVFSLIIILLMIASISYSQSTATKAVTGNPIGLAYGLFNAQYEFALNQKNSVAVRANFVGYSIGGYANSAFGFGGSYRWYVMDSKTIVGWWAQPSADILFWTSEWTAFQPTSLNPNAQVNKQDNTVFFGLGGDGGYKWIWDHFALDVSLGARVYIGKISGLRFGGVGPQLGVNLGYAW